MHYSIDQHDVGRRDFLKACLAGTAAVSTPQVLWGETMQEQRPNILWITSEDNSPLFGCFGDTFATTPNFDRLATEGICYKNTFANVPVCGPTRFTLLTGMYACAMGTLHMRSRYAVPSFVGSYPEYLREAGYYCSNCSKTDYNFQTNDKRHWDDCSREATYRNRKPGQPFFSIFNLTVTHESCIHKRKENIRHDPTKVQLPPYHPDTPEVRHDWAQYYDAVEDLDTQVGEILDQLREDGLEEDTIVFYYSDHGGVLCRSKRFLYDTGTRVPMIIRFPKKFQHLAPGAPGTSTDRIVSFVDFAPTLLSLTGVEIPDYMQGEAFLGRQAKAPREYAYLFRGRMDERYDMMRAVRDKQFKYIRNYMPHRIYGLHLGYLWKAATTRVWEQAYLEGRCNETQSIFWQAKPSEELYDVTIDPWEVNNLASDPAYTDVLERMRKANSTWVRETRDPGFMPEGQMLIRSGGTTSFELVHEEGFPVQEIIETAEMATSRDAEKLPEIGRRLHHSDETVRFWAAVGCTVLGNEAKSAEESLLQLLKDDSPDVRIASAEALCNLNKEDKALPVLLNELRNEQQFVALHAANAVDAIGEKASPCLPDIESVKKTTEENYLKRALSHTVRKLQDKP